MGQTTSVDIDISYRVTLFDFYLHTNKTLIKKQYLY